jgi:hypothetical protein
VGESSTTYTTSESTAYTTSESCTTCTTSYAPLSYSGAHTSEIGTSNFGS